MSNNIMEVHEVPIEASAEYKWFAKYPLLGSAIISESNLNKIHDNAKYYIDRIIQEPLAIEKLSIKAKMQITLSLIDYTKKWDNGLNPQFWNYIILQYGYRDNNGYVIKLLQTCVQDSMIANNRWFLKGKYNREFVATLVIHAFSPKKSWYRVMDFLFDFYQENLQHDYVQNDPIIWTMTQALKHKLENSTENKLNDMELTISNKVYSFQQGVWKLVTMQPKYAAILFDHILAFMNQLTNGGRLKARTYEEALCKEWFEQRLSVSLSSAEQKVYAKTKKREIAFGYAQVRPHFYLVSDDFGIVLPNVRMPREKIDNAYIHVYVNDTLVLIEDFEYYGNELGRTLIGKSISLVPYTSMLRNDFKIKIQILCDEKIEYDSKEYLYRKAVIFENGKEIAFSGCKTGCYTILSPDRLGSQFKKTTIIETRKLGHCLIRKVILEEGFYISIGRKALAIDYVDSQHIQLTLPEPFKDVSFRLNGQEYSIIDEYSGITVHTKDGKNVHRYDFLINGNAIQIDTSRFELVSTGFELFVPIKNNYAYGDLINIQIIDTLAREIIYEGSYIILPSVTIAFNKPIYVFSDDYENAYAKWTVGKEEFECPVYDETEIVSIPWGEGEIISHIPLVNLQMFDEPWAYKQIIWYEEIDNNTTINIKGNMSLKTQIFLDDTILNINQAGDYALGEATASRKSKTGEKSVLTLHYNVSGNRKKRILGEIYWSDTFTEPVKIWSKENIYWNLGGTFIGDQESVLILKLTNIKNHLYEYHLDIMERKIAPFEEKMEGAYHFKIIKVLDGEEKELAQGDCVLGDINNVRFKDKIIRIETLTDDDNHLTSIRPVFIEKIKFFDVMETSEGICPVYYGIMYTWFASTKTKIPFADRSIANVSSERELVNPVRIVYINDSVLCITNDEGEGLYYRWVYIASQDKRVYELTDKSYTKKTKGSYGLADLYRYNVFQEINKRK